MTHCWKDKTEFEDMEKPRLAEWFQYRVDKYKADYCPRCDVRKVKRVRWYKLGKSQRLRREKIVPIDYKLNAGDRLISVYCPKCLIMFEENK